MKKRMLIGMAVSAMFLLLGTFAHAQVDGSAPELNAAVATIAGEGLLLAHHVGNAPDWAGPDMEDWNVHGGDWSDMEDPNPETPTYEPEKRPTEEPSSGSTVNNRKNSGTATQSGRSN